MPLFPSREWCEEAVRLANADPESAEAGRGWEGDFGLVVEAERGLLSRAFAVHCVPEGGRIEKLEVLADPDDLEAIEPKYLVRAPYSVWKALMQGTLDPVEAILRKRLALSGDVQPLIERMRHKSIADRVLAQLETRYADEG